MAALSAERAACPAFHYESGVRIVGHGSSPDAGEWDAMADEPDLRQGAEGEWVTYLQQWLAHLGYYGGAVDGSFGQVTQDAVNAVQAQYSIGDGGAVSAETWHLITMARTKDETGLENVWGDSEVNTVGVPEMSADGAGS
jgi:peptidoglycan hydrolase-like protein with peptidoglycan-binding domain